MSANLGTRPGLYGQTIISTGLADLDRLLGGGLPVGSLTLILEDEWTQHHVTLLRYFLGEGAACGQSIMLAGAKEPEGGLETFLPRQADGNTPLDTTKSSGSETKEDDVQLRIAWQYGKYLRRQDDQPDNSSGNKLAPSPSPLSGGGGGGGGSSNASLLRGWCHSFDLTKPAGPSSLQNCKHETHMFTRSHTGSQLAKTAAEFVTSLTPPTGAPLAPTHIGRLGVVSLGSLEGGVEDGPSFQISSSSSRAALQSLIRIKAIVRETRCCAIVTVPASLYNASNIKRMQHIADAVLSLTAVEEGSEIVRLAPDMQSVAGLLKLLKLPSMGALAAPTPQISLYFVRYKRKKLAITPVEIDPDAEAAAAEAEGGGGSAASVLCGGPPKKNASSASELDF